MDRHQVDSIVRTFEQADLTEDLEGDQRRLDER